MRYVSEFRDPAAARALVGRIRRLGERLRAAGRRARIMEVCGTHTMAIGRYGIRDVLPPGIELLSGPGCPVCVTSPGYVDAAIELARAGATIATFGDMLHVPGSDTRDSLARCRATGGRVEVCYSPRAALDLAVADKDRPVVFLAIGFETTIAPVARLVDLAARRGVDNLHLLTAFKLVPPALHALLADDELAIDAFLCPAHVSAIIGAEAYAPFAGEHGVPCVIAGFEPLDILLGIAGILAQLAGGEARVENQYSRVVRPRGNPRARALMERLLEVDEADWRGLGHLPRSGLRLRREYAAWDARTAMGIEVGPGRTHPGCGCGEVIKGKLRPEACPQFGRGCTPRAPLGPCMVSSEGSCAAAYRYARAGAGHTGENACIPEN